MKKIIIMLLVLATLGLTACSNSTQADVASENLATAAEEFEIIRRIVFTNAIHDTDMLLIEGRCSFEDYTTQVQVTCRIDEDKYLKHVMGKSDNTLFIVEQLELAEVDVFRYRRVFRPQTLIPDIDISTSPNQ